MADFTTWKRETLEQFAAEATDELMKRGEHIKELRCELNLVRDQVQSRDAELWGRTQEILSLHAKLDGTKARIDALMLEYCPEDMTPEQLAEWGKHQRVAEEQQ